ncbi:microtubule-associated protein Jupiter-like isoform X2 [Argopecten irradians]|uniref:microtubule-associated protein Jupiter-like isoform X2 n=1 Tax=Argopecten irradians TaxID=31199 RepID=UPI003719F532
MSTHTFQGLRDDKNSSRVLKPPGGGSSNLFGAPTPTAAESASQSRSKQTSSNIFGDPYNPATDVTRSDQRAAQQEQQRKQGQLAIETPTYVRAEKPQEDTQSKLFGDDTNQSRRTGKGQASSFNPITGETYTGSEEEMQPSHTGKRKGAQSIGAYNPITGEEYKESQAREAASNGDGPQKIRNSSKVLAPPGGKSSGIF